jgi:ribonuclease M5
MEKLIIDRPIIVEGKYDKIALSTVLDANIITTGGFSLFNKKERLSLIRQLGEKHGIILLTDSDGGGRQIRSYITSALPKEKVINLYIPKIEGKEKRKRTPSKAGLLGVEGMDKALLYKLFEPFSASEDVRKDVGGITKTDLYSDGLSGSSNSKEKRAELARALSLPDDMTANALLEAMNLLISKEEYTDLVKRLSLGKNDN